MQPNSEQEDNTTRRDFLRVADSPVAIDGHAGSPPTPSQTEGQDLCLLSALEMTRLLREKRLSARELMAAHLRQIERINPRVNAIVTLVAEQALREAERADALQAAGEPVGPLHGLPVAIKDLHDTAGIRTTYGSRLYGDHVPEHDSLIVERIRRAGAIIVGKTNTPEFGAGSQTFNAVFGATRNPYDLTKTCGGSSGGAAVALACGMTPLADGSDLGGSLRNPASFCNVVGLRPAAGRVPSQNPILGWQSLGVDGPMARSVADLALFLSAIAGPDDRSPISITEPGSLFARPLARDVQGTRLAWWQGLGGVPFDPRVVAVVEAHRATFEALGCRIEEAEPDFTGADEAFKTLRAWSAAARHGALVRNHRDYFKQTLIDEVEQGERLTGRDVSRAEEMRTSLYHRMRMFLETYDYFVLPVTQVPPFDVEQPFVREIAGRAMQTYIDWMKSCYFISITGHPAISVPAGFTPEGLPVGLQIVGPHRGEFGLLQVAHAFEQASSAGRRVSFGSE